MNPSGKVDSIHKLICALLLPYRALVADLDDTLTLPGRRLLNEAIQFIDELLKRGVLVAIVTARGWNGDRDGQGAKASEVVSRINAQYDEIGLPNTDRVARLEKLIIVPENGGYAVQAQDTSNRIDFGLQSAADCTELMEAIPALLSECGYSVSTQTIGRKEISVTIRLNEASDAQIEDAYNAISRWVRKQGVRFVVQQSKNSLEIFPVDGGKLNAMRHILKHFAECRGFSIKEHHVLTIGDKGATGGVDHPMLARTGGWSVAEWDEDSPMVPVPAVLLADGWEATKRVLNLVRFEPVN